MSTPGTTNRAVSLSRFGSPEVLGVVSVPVAAPGPLDALVRVRAAAVNPSDTLLRTGGRPNGWEGSVLRSFRAWT
jgi:NADPH:quinone reductase